MPRDIENHRCCVTNARPLAPDNQRKMLVHGTLLGENFTNKYGKTTDRSGHGCGRAAAELLSESHLHRELVCSRQKWHFIGIIYREALGIHVNGLPEGMLQWKIPHRTHYSRLRVYHIWRYNPRVPVRFGFVFARPSREFVAKRNHDGAPLPVGIRTPLGVDTKNSRRVYGLPCKGGYSICLRS